LYLVQHAEAVSKQEDPERPISEEGRANAKKMADHAYHVLHLEIENMLYSRKLRAKQTAEVFSKSVKPTSSLEQTTDLEPLAEPAIWVERLKEMDGSVMLVGHMPHLSRLTSALLTGNVEKEVVDFKNAGIVHLERIKKDDWVLQWELTPEGISKELTFGS
jgi:phosphohistidine phosphatase